MTFLRFSAISAVLALAMAIGIRFYSTAGHSGETQRIAVQKPLETMPQAVAPSPFDDVALVASVPKRALRPNH